MSFGLYNAVINEIVFIPEQQSFIPIHNEILFSTQFFDINLLNQNLKPNNYPSQLKVQGPTLTNRCNETKVMSLELDCTKCVQN